MEAGSIVGYGERIHAEWSENEELRGWRCDLRWRGTDLCI